MSEATPPRGTVIRDDHGVPRVMADDEASVLHTQGFVTARDRAWQLVSDRWRARGEWAAAIGVGGIAWDRFAAMADLRGTVAHAWGLTGADTRALVEHHAQGVRDGLATLSSRDIPELQHLALPKSAWQGWEATDALGAWWVQHVLFGSWHHRVWDEHVARALGEEWAEAFRSPPVTVPGSNATGVPPHHSVSGHALLGADPHRILEAPGVYQQIRLTCLGDNGFDVCGLTVPGVPGVQHFGHTGGVAWVISNAMAESSRIVTVDGQAHTSHHTIRVRGGEDVSVHTTRTVRGPSIARRGDGSHLVLVTSADRVGLGFDALPGLWRARSTRDVRRALLDWVDPVNSVIVAGDDGLWEGVVGRIVDDDTTHPVQRWRPSDTPVVHANQRRDQTEDLGHHFAPPDRAIRLRELISHHAVTADHLWSAHMDPRSADMMRLARWSDACWSSFDGEMRGESSLAADADRWRRHFVWELGDDPRLSPLHELHGAAADLTRHHPMVLAPFWLPRQRIATAWEGLAALDPTLVASAAAAADDRVRWRSSSGRWRDIRTLHASHALGWDVRLTGTDGDVESVFSVTPLPGGLGFRGPAARFVVDLGAADACRWAVPMGADGRIDAAHSGDQFHPWASGNGIPMWSHGAPLHPLSKEHP